MKNGYIYLLLTAIFWSFAGVCIRFNAQSVLLISVVNAVIGLTFNTIFNKQKLVINRTVIFAGLCQFMMGITFVLANQLTTIGNAIILQYTSMIFVLIYQTIDQKRLPQFKHIMTILIVIIGMILFFFDSLTFQGVIGNIMAIISGAFYGLQFYVNTKSEAHPYTSMILNFVISLCMIGFVLKDFGTVTSTEWLAMLVSGIVCAGLGSLCFSRGIAITDAFSANIICMSEILFSPIWAFVIFNEVIGTSSFLGACIIVIGIIYHIYLESKNTLKEVKL